MTEHQPLHGRCALVAGGSRGIGAAIARRLARDGAAVTLTYATREDAAAEVVAGIEADGGTARAVPLDVADPARVGPVVDEAAPDVLVANAGIAHHAPLADTTLEDWDRVMAVNARGVLLAVQHAAARMPEGGRIVVVSTIGTHWPSPGETVYAASKAAVEQIARVASRELGPRGITVNTVAAGPTDTDLLRAGAPPEALAGAAAMTALGRIGRPDDIADLVALLCRPDAGWLTGATLRADGGLT
ncbi:SDR family oxidoreductase [Actinomycetospora sp. C-140]